MLSPIVIVSHRRHSLPAGTSVLTLDRVIASTLILRRVSLPEVVQDERVTKGALGVDSERTRRRIAIVLDGESQEFVDDRAVPCRRGDCVFVPEGASHASRSGSDTVLELEWNTGALDDGAARSSTRMKLGMRAQATARRVAEDLRTAVSGASMVEPLTALLSALNAEGMSFRVDAVRGLEAASPDDQSMMNGIDRILSRLHENPMLVDLESTLGQARRTLTRSIGQLHERHALLGRGGGRWRTIRDNYRLVVATILVSHEEATPRDVAGLVGYGSVEALDHALNNASLPSPLALKRAIRFA